MISQSNAPIDNSARGGVAEVENPEFTEASERANIVSGESIPTLFGKIKKFFTDLKAVAFSGSYTDLSDKPTIPSKVSDLTNDSGFINGDAVLLSRGTPFWYPNNDYNARKFSFSNLGVHESIHLLLFTRYGAYIILGICATGSFSSVTAYPLYSDASSLTITVLEGYEFIVNTGSWCAIYGLYVHPHYPESVLTVTPERV